MTTYLVRVPFAGEWLTANPRSTTDRYGRSRSVKSWRESVVMACRAAKLPTSVTPVRIYAWAYYVGHRPVRDRLNLAPTIKACVDGLTPQKIITRGTKRYVTPGYGLLPDDSDTHVLETSWDLAPSPTGQPWVVLEITHLLVPRADVPSTERAGTTEPASPAESDFV